MRSLTVNSGIYVALLPAMMLWSVPLKAFERGMGDMIEPESHHVCQLIREEGDVKRTLVCRHTNTGGSYSMSADYAESKVSTEIHTKIEESFLRFQHKALQTRAGSYLMRHHRDALLQVCDLPRDERKLHIDTIATNLGFTGEARSIFIVNLQNKIDRGVIC